MTQTIVAQRSAPEGEDPSPAPAARPVVEPVPSRSTKPVDPAAAEDFLRLYYAETPAVPSLYARLREVRAEIAGTGTYTHTPEELIRCPGRLAQRGSLHRPAVLAQSPGPRPQGGTGSGRCRGERVRPPAYGEQRWPHPAGHHRPGAGLP
jgi:hypothetical protein